MSNAILYRMPSGIPGDVSRKSQSTITSEILNASLPFASYGIPAKKASGKVVPFAGGETAADLYGFLVRPYPTQSAQEGLGTATPPTSGVGNILRRGWMTVKCNAGTPADGGTVYVRIAAASGAKVIGGIEAAADSTNTVALTGVKFTNAGDANGNVEIEYNI
ncbi:hypothetical protein LQ772_06785 [Frateuria edaphi]|uniref:structural cement protein Gp24 n=1 Tax=Frateuria edaphi TaxID=2898793 RepID=UPI001E55EE51|nr:hypothetical protein [Frateuria edaphi]UGB46991.1 hypothetical protein LQ772_06785 [Frateuria edaphi]